MEYHRAGAIIRAASTQPGLVTSLPRIILSKLAFASDVDQACIRAFPWPDAAPTPGMRLAVSCFPHRTKEIAQVCAIPRSLTSAPDTMWSLKLSGAGEPRLSEIPPLFERDKMA